jgi:hypothetical protein
MQYPEDLNSIISPVCSTENSNVQTEPSVFPGKHQLLTELTAGDFAHQSSLPGGLNLP